jgi:hypothetical protein
MEGLGWVTYFFWKTLCVSNIRLDLKNHPPSGRAADTVPVGSKVVMQDQRTLILR